MRTGQTRVDIKLNEGDEEDLEFVKQIAKGTGRFGRPVPKGYPITVKIDYTRAGLIELNAYDGETGAFLCKLEVERPGNLSTGQVANAAELFRKTKVS